jgi:Ca2+-transporting ATPase
MGKTATDLTKDSASIILTDDNFTSIVSAVQEGRRTYDNIQKFVFYLLACNSAEIYVMLIAVIVGLPIPFTPMMILWANLIAGHLLIIIL